MQSALQVAYVALDFRTHGNAGSIRGDQILRQFSFELFAGRILSRVECVFELNFKLRIGWDHIGCAWSLIALVKHRSLAHVDLSRCC